MEKVNITFRMDKNRVQVLDELGQCFDRDRSYLVNQAVEEFLTRQQWQVEEVKRARKDVADGKVLSEEAFLADIQSWL